MFADRRRDEEFSFITSSRPWVKPLQFHAFHFTMIGAGGGGGSGANNSGTNPRGGTGGTAGARSDFIIPSLFVPDVLDITIGLGGEGGVSQALTLTAGQTGQTGGDTIIKYQSATLITAPGGTGGGGGGVSSSGAVGAVVSATGNWVALGVWMANTSQPGSQPTGGGVSSQFPSGGAAGSTLLNAVNTNCTLASYIGTSYGWITPTSVANVAGLHGFMINHPIYAVTGGGGASGSTSRNNDDRPGGNGSYGCGGGGGAAANDAFNTGAGGRGGDGLVIIMGW